MYDLDKHPYFERYTDPASGVESFILTEKITPLVQSMYFTNQAMSSDERLLWFYCGFPPSPYKSLGVLSLDPDNPFIKNFPASVFADASPAVAPEGDAVYYAIKTKLYKLYLTGKIEEFAELDPDYVGNRRVEKISTHLTMSCDGKYLLLDGLIGNKWFVATIDTATKKTNIIHEFRQCYNHSQFSPVVPNLFLIDQDNHIDPITGEQYIFDHRMWLMNLEQTMFAPAVPRNWFEHNSVNAHDFWSADGYLCWIDYKLGAFEMNVSTGEINHVWKTPLCHTHTSSNRKYWCADESPYKWHEKPCKVIFYNRETEKETDIFSSLPQPYIPMADYHLHPHPQFSPKDNYITSTTTVKGDIDIAITPVDQLIN